MPSHPEFERFAPTHSDVSPMDIDGAEKKEDSVDGDDGIPVHVPLDVRSVSHTRARSATWKLPPASQKIIDDRFARLPLPSSFANRTLRPFRNTGKMNMHAWVKFVECWGAYLLADVFEGVNADVLTRFFEVLFLIHVVFL